MLEVRGITVYRESVLVLRNLSFKVKRGELVALLGANGAGKSTLLGALAGLYRPLAGEILLENHPITGKPAERVVRRGVSLVPERRQVFHSLSVRDNLLLGAYHCFRRKKEKIETALQEVLNIFPALQEKVAQPAGTLSGGLQQMLAIGRGLMSDPKLLMLDEPSVGLAPMVVQEIMTILAGLKERGKTIILVEQNARAALKVADRAWIVERGEIVLSGRPDELSNNERVRQAYLGNYQKVEQPVAL
ncbi:MAG: ABC transporter ATP-binding protein [Peptococcaceae bacterium]|nr:MAG: ABC transporter ATP-binding protein [Peptococcaceae bacterium]